MKTIYVIQDVKTKEYYWQYRIDEDFNANISEAKTFDSKEDAVNEFKLQDEWSTDLFAERFIEIKEYYKFNGAQRKA